MILNRFFTTNLNDGKESVKAPKVLTLPAPNEEVPTLKTAFIMDAIELRCGFQPEPKLIPDNWDSVRIQYEEVISLSNLKEGLARTKSNVSPGLDGEVKSDITEKRLQRLHEDLSWHRYKPSPSKRVGIPKPDGGVRYLGVASQIDKVVQGAILNKLEPLLEKKFVDQSYGYRPGKGCHDALRDIKYKWKASTWIINVDISKCFDTLNHQFLRELLKNFCDQATVELIGKLLKVGYVDIHNLNDRAEYSVEGTPQGSLISPILSNLYLHELDKFVVKEILPAFTLGVERAARPDYKKRYNLSESDQNLLNQYPELKNALARVKHHRTVLERRRFTATEAIDPGYRRIHYVRYSDDFLIGFIGPKEEADLIVDYIKRQLKLMHLQINEKKSKVFHSSEMGIKYLGVYIRYFNKNKPVIEEQNSFVTDTELQVNALRAQAINTAQMRAPIDKITNRFVDRGVAKRREDGTVRATAYIKYSMLEDAAIVQRFSAIIRGLMNYYSCINHRSDLWKVLSILRKSCALTLAHKHKLGSAARAYKKYTKNITIKDDLGRTLATLSYPKSLKTKIDFKTRGGLSVSSPEVFDMELNRVQGSHKTNIKTSDKCEYGNCEITENLEAHHLHPMADLSKRKDLTPLEKALIGRKRKVIMLCKKHHNQIHKKGLVNTPDPKLANKASGKKEE